MGQFTLLNCFVSFSLDDSMSKAESKSRLPNPDGSSSMNKNLHKSGTAGFFN